MAMALRFDVAISDRRAAGILAKTILKELRTSGYSDEDILALASELVGAVTAEMKVKRTSKG